MTGGHDRAPLPVAGIRAMVLGLCGEADAVRGLLDPRTNEVDAIDPLGSEMADQLSLVISLALLSIEETERAGSLLQRAVSGARERSAIGLLPFRLGRLAWVHYWDGRWSAARGCVHEALQLAESTGWVNERPSSLATLARSKPSPVRREGAVATSQRRSRAPSGWAVAPTWRTPGRLWGCWN